MWPNDSDLPHHGEYRAGVDPWVVSDEEILKQSTDMSGQYVDVEDAANLAVPWGDGGGGGGRRDFP